jgi:Lipid A core - O-antigen ligase and related enzymes
MLAPVTVSGEKTTHQKISSSLEIITFILCAITLLTALINNSLSMKLFNISGGLALLTLLVRGKSTSISGKACILPAAILLIGIADVIWYSLFKSGDSPFRATYHNYLNTAKVFLVGAFVVLLAATSTFKLRKDAFFYPVYAISFLIFAYAAWLKLSVGMARIDFGIGTATGAAYSIMLIGLISALSILYTEKSHPLLFLLNAAAVLVALIFTQTRSAVLLFPIICCVTIFLYYSRTPKKLFLSVSGFVGLLIIVGTIFSTPITQRYNAAIHDVNTYQINNNSRSSLGARLAMYEVGMDIFHNDPLAWRSAGERAQSAKMMVAKDKSLSGVLPFLNIHLHNEIIEAASLKGVVGILFTLLFYAALFYAVYFFRSLGLFSFTLAIIGLGLSDVLIWARSIPIILICGISVLLYFNSQRIRPSVVAE